MKILAFADLHGSEQILKKIIRTAKKDKVDFIISGGDHTIFGDSMKEIITDLDKIGIPVLMTHGNHESENVMKKACRKKKNVKFLHKEILETGDYVFIFYGGGGFSKHDREFEIWAEEVMPGIDEKKKLILSRTRHHSVQSWI